MCSLNAIKIVYSMPTHDAFLMAEEGKIKLEIKGIRASVGGYFGGYYEVDIDFQSRKLKWDHLSIGAEEHYEKTIKQITLDKFIDELKMLDLLNWKTKYIESGICDGTQWSLEIIRDGRNINKYGDNKFPDNWDQFCNLIKKISGKSFE